MAEIKVEMIGINGASLEEENPLPFFRDRRHDLPLSFIEPFPIEKKTCAGYETGFRVLPYRMQDRYSRKRRTIGFKKITISNKYLEASFLPEVGGRLISLIDRTTGRELLYRNPVFQPANLAIRNAWFSGGIEWNIGQLGHAFHTCSPVFAAAVAGKSGENFLRIYEFERCKRLFWQIDFHLPPDSKVLYAFTKVSNRYDESVPMYWWTNTAVPETPELRIFSSADDVIYTDLKGVVSKDKSIGYSKMPYLPSLPGKDFSYPFNSDSANEYFFQCPEIRMPWEAAVYKDGETFFEVSTSRLRYKKMFCWGTHKGGRQWQEFLSDKGSAYVEIQAGLAPTQMHGMDMPGKTDWEWTQAFGSTYMDIGKSHEDDWYTARSCVEENIMSVISEKELYVRDELFRLEADIHPDKLLNEGSGWGALEIERMYREGHRDAPHGLKFAASTIREEQYPWLMLLESGRLAERDPEGLPGAWMVQREWRQLLLASLDKEENRNWYALLHAGVMDFEEGFSEEAVSLWKESVKKCPSVWAYRNLAIAAKEKGDISLALEYMKKLWQMPAALLDKSLAEEYLTLLRDSSMYGEAWNIYEGLPEHFKTAERISLIIGPVAMELGKTEFVEQLFTLEYSGIREGETTLSELWFRYHAERLAKEKGIDIDGQVMNFVKSNYPLPDKLDFRVIE